VTTDKNPTEQQQQQSTVSTSTSTSEDERIPVLVQIKGDSHLTHAVGCRCVIGRSPECSVWLMDRLVSRRHAEIRALDEGGHQIVDLGSKFGTFINRKPILGVTLQTGDQIFVGSTLLRFEKKLAADVPIRRHQNRLKCLLPVRVTVEGQVVQTQATDISLGGLRLDWGISPGPGTPMNIEITLPGSKPPLCLDGHANQKSDAQGLGVRFYFTSEQEERDLAEAYAQIYLSDPDAQFV
jgi:pSer/pThr/pTyr-binding forkhead associated (FHA) protein